MHYPFLGVGHFERESLIQFFQCFAGSIERNTYGFVTYVIALQGKQHLQVKEFFVNKSVARPFQH